MFEALVIIFWFIVFYLGHKLYCAHKIKMMRKKWNCWLPLSSKT